MSQIANLKLKARLYYYAAVVRKVYDGDTITVDLDLGLSVWRHGQKIRFWRVNTPELRGPERERGLMVRDFVRERVLGKTVLIRTILDKRGSDRSGKFGRLLGEVLYEDAAGTVTNLNDELMAKGYALPVTPEGVTIAGAVARDAQHFPDHVACPFCGERRDVDPTSGQVAMCPNCLDTSFRSLVA